MAIEQKNKNSSQQKLRFSDVATTHTMRRTAITTMLSLGVPEQVIAGLLLIHFTGFCFSIYYTRVGDQRTFITFRYIKMADWILTIVAGCCIVI